MVNVTKRSRVVKEGKHHTDIENFLAGQFPHQPTHQDKVSRTCLANKNGL